MKRNILFTLITLTLLASSALAAKATVQPDFNREVANVKALDSMFRTVRFLSSKGKV